MRNERGITLIALVVTIIVLLILAGVTITYALSDNGIFSKAKEAGMASEQAVIRDAVSTAQAEAMIEYYQTPQGTSTASDLLGHYLSGSLKVTTAPSLTDGTLSGSATFTSDKYTHSVTIENGVVTNIDSTAKSN